MTELSLRMLTDIAFNLLPVPLVISNFLAGGADGKEAA